MTIKGLKTATWGMIVGVIGTVGTALWGLWFLVGCGIVGALIVGFVGSLPEDD